MSNFKSLCRLDHDRLEVPIFSLRVNFLMLASALKTGTVLLLFFCLSMAFTRAVWRFLHGRFGVVSTLKRESVPY